MQVKYASTFGGSEFTRDSEEYLEGIRLGEFLCAKGYVVKNGGYYGLMEAVSRGVSNLNGQCIGILNEQFDPKAPNQFLSSYVKERDLFDRLRTLVKDTELFIFQSGSIGTIEELMTVWCLRYTLQIQSVNICLIGKNWHYLVEGLVNLNINKKEFIHLEMYENLDRFIADFDSIYNQELK